MNGRSQRLLNMAASNQLMPLYTEARASRSSHSHMSSKHGNTEEALERIGGLNLELDLLHAFSPAADKLGKRPRRVRDLHPKQHRIHSELRETLPSWRNDQYRVCRNRRLIRSSASGSSKSSRCSGRRGAHTSYYKHGRKVLNDDLENVFRDWYPQFHARAP